jgi:hypothetical protein
MTFFMLELSAPDPAALAAWYVEQLKLEIILQDLMTGFRLLEGRGLKLAIKPGPAAAGIILHFEVEDLAGWPGEVKVSPEGYERKKLCDPLGSAVVVFRRTVTAFQSSPPPPPGH